MEASKLSSRAANVGFDWPNIEGLLDKLREETDELKKRVGALPRARPNATSSRSGGFIRSK